MSTPSQLEPQDSPAEIVIKSTVTPALLRNWKRKINAFSKLNLEDARRLEELGELAERQPLTDEQNNEGVTIANRRAEECSRLLAEMQDLIAKLDPQS